MTIMMIIGTKTPRTMPTVLELFDDGSSTGLFLGFVVYMVAGELDGRVAIGPRVVGVPNEDRNN